jgi:hypothetical protein
MSAIGATADDVCSQRVFRLLTEVGQFPSFSAEDGPLHISEVIGSLISGPVKETAIGRRTPGSTATSESSQPRLPTELSARRVPTLTRE